MPRVGGLTIALAGGAGSGKSTVASAIATKLGGQVAAFGDYVRHLAVEAGESPDRTSLQRIGQGNVEARPSEFVRDFLRWASPEPDVPLVIDGVRHAVVDQLLRAWASACARAYFLVVLDTAIEARVQRQADGDEDVLRRIDAHPVERETWAALPRLAELVVDGSGSVADIIERIAAAAPDPLSRVLR